MLVTHRCNGYLVIIGLFHLLLWVLKLNKCSHSSYPFSDSVVININQCLLLHYGRILNEVTATPAGRAIQTVCHKPSVAVLCFRDYPCQISEFPVNNLLNCMLTLGDKGAERPENLTSCPRTEDELGLSCWLPLPFRGSAPGGRAHSNTDATCTELLQLWSQEQRKPELLIFVVK